MDPPPDYGFDKYQGTGKLKGKVVPRTTDGMHVAPACMHLR